MKTVSYSWQVQSVSTEVRKYAWNIHISCKVFSIKLTIENHSQGPDFDDMSYFFPREIDDAIQYTNLEYGAQAPKMVIL
jgi:hypothetical protein